MSATATKRRPAKFPTAARYTAAERALQRGYDELERLVWNLNAIVFAWTDEERVLDRPTFETIGRLADFIDGLDVQLDQCTVKRDELRDHLSEVMSMRGTLDHREKREADDAR